MPAPLAGVFLKACFALAPVVAVPVVAVPVVAVPSVVLADISPVPAPSAPGDFGKPAPKKPNPKPAVEVTSPIAAPPADADPAAALVAKVQSFYERTKDFTATFDQVYRYKTMTRRLSSTGTVQVKKPGFMRWDYEQPAKKAFVVDGKSLWIHEPEENSVMVQRAFSQDSLSAAVSFLRGRGKLTDEFDASIVVRRDVGATVLLLVPKRPQPGFSKVYFGVEEATGAVVTSLVVDTQGNENRITFKDVKSNTGLAESAFKFTVPKGATVRELGVP